MSKCRRCGQPFELRDAHDRHCLRCIAEVDALLAKPAPAWEPPWRARLTARDETRRAA
jgi:hypothetical protein